MSVGKRIAWVLSLAAFSVTGVLGIYNGVTEWPDTRTLLQKSVDIGVLIYGFLGVAGLIALFRRERSSVAVALAWTIVVTYVSGAAVLAYRDPDTNVGAAVAAAAGSALIGAGIIWTAKVSAEIGRSA
jgi:FtsH-binding integral membrane protein